jgi:DNA polymerase-4
MAAAGQPMTIIHVDMDAFYASVEQRDRPELRGRPVIVGGSARQRGVVCAASYEARPFGVHSAMAMARALKLCPDAVVVPPRMAHYAAVSRQIFDICFSFTPLVEPLSLDEAYLDVRGCEQLFGLAADIARRLKGRIAEDVGLVASVGVSCNKFLAKLASDHGKPDGFVILPADQVRAFLDPLPVSRIWGVGPKAEKRLKEIGIHTIGQLAHSNGRLLADHFGDSGRHMWQLARGDDRRAVVPDREAKSVSTETTFASDIGDQEVLLTWLLELVEHLGSRLRRHGLLAQTVELKLRSSDFRTYSRSQSLPEPTNLTKPLWLAARSLLVRSLDGDLLPLRLLGIGASRLVRSGEAQGSLFDEESQRRESELDSTIDAIREEFGREAIQRGNLMDRRDNVD